MSLQNNSKDIILSACSVHFDNTPVPLENVLGQVGGGFKVKITQYHNNNVIISTILTILFVMY